MKTRVSSFAGGARSRVLIAVLTILVVACGPSTQSVPTANATTAIATATAAATPAPVSSAPPTTSAPTRNPADPIVLKTGMATVDFTVGAKKQSIAVPLTQGQLMSDGTIVAIWDNLTGGRATQGLILNIPGGKSGTYQDDGKHNPNYYVSFYVEIIGGDVHNVVCQVAISRTSADAISGTIDCKGNMRGFGEEPVTAKGTFAAAP